MPDMNESDSIFVLSQSLKDSVDAVAGKAKDRINSPCQQPLDEDVGCIDQNSSPHWFDGQSFGCPCDEGSFPNGGRIDRPQLQCITLGNSRADNISSGKYIKRHVVLKP